VYRKLLPTRERKEPGGGCIMLSAAGSCEHVNKPSGPQNVKNFSTTSATLSLIVFSR
jgi:hypothetical protein